MRTRVKIQNKWLHFFNLKKEVCLVGCFCCLNFYFAGTQLMSLILFLWIVVYELIFISSFFFFYHYFLVMNEFRVYVYCVLHVFRVHKAHTQTHDRFFPLFVKLIVKWRFYNVLFIIAVVIVFMLLLIMLVNHKTNYTLFVCICVCLCVLFIFFSF